MSATSEDHDPAPATVTVDPSDNGVYEIESLCMHCGENGVTRILPIQIPHFRQILIESFSCDHCGDHNNSVKNAGAIQEKGVKYTFRLDSADDLQRSIVRSDTGMFRINDLELDMPLGPGQFTNIESMVSKASVDLQKDQEIRKELEPELYHGLSGVIERLQQMLEGKAYPIFVSLDDISGNSFIEPDSADQGSKFIRQDYLRTHEQNVELGLVVDDEIDEADVAEDAGGVGLDDVNVVDGEVYELPAECPACSKPCTVNAKKVNIPYFTSVVILATVCDHCGYRTSDIKTGGEIPDKGKRITLRVEKVEDLSRDILKSETCALKSAELGLEVQPGTLGGRFTTVEGLLRQVRDQLHGQIFDFENEDLAAGDAMPTRTKAKWESFFKKLDEALSATIPFSITLEDPLASSFVQPLTEDDPQLTTELYERSADEIEDLGLNDMNVEGYGEDADNTGD